MRRCIVFLLLLFPFIAQARRMAVKEIKMGDMRWAVLNLETNRYRDGEEIKQAKTEAEWEECAQKHIGCWCYYNNEEGITGRLYNYYAVIDTHGLAPYGWHIPSAREFEYLVKVSGGNSICGKKLKSKVGWKKSNKSKGSNSWNGMGGGCRYPGGAFNYATVIGYWWTTTEDSKGKVQVFNLYHDRNSCAYTAFAKSYGFSVRCVRD